MTVSMAIDLWRETESDVVLMANLLAKSLPVDFQKVGNIESELACPYCPVSDSPLGIFNFAYAKSFLE